MKKIAILTVAICLLVLVTRRSERVTKLISTTTKNFRNIWLGLVQQ